MRTKFLFLILAGAGCSSPTDDIAGSDSDLTEGSEVSVPDLTAKAEEQFATKPAGTRDSVLVWQSDGAAPRVVTSELTVEAPNADGPFAVPVFKISAAPAGVDTRFGTGNTPPDFEATMRVKTNTLAVETYPCASYEGSVAIANGGAPLKTADCTITITKRYQDALPPEVAVVAKPRTVDVGRIEATIPDPSGSPHVVRAGFVVIE
jgi:hypothetical protein